MIARPNPVNGTCTTCHDTPNVGNHSVKLPINIGVVAPNATGLDTSGLPVFTLRCDLVRWPARNSR